MAWAFSHLAGGSFPSTQPSVLGPLFDFLGLQQAVSSDSQPPSESGADNYIFLNLETCFMGAGAFA